MINKTAILNIILLVFLFISCNNCRNDDCAIFSANVCFDLVNDMGNSLIFDEGIYNMDSIIINSNLINNSTIFLNAFQRGSNNNCIVIMTDTTTRYFVQLNQSDIDTIDLVYKIKMTEYCRNTTTEVVENFNMMYNLKNICIDCPSNSIIEVNK